MVIMIFMFITVRLYFFLGRIAERNLLIAGRIFLRHHSQELLYFLEDNAKRFQSLLEVALFLKLRFWLSLLRLHCSNFRLKNRDFHKNRVPDPNNLP